MWKPVLKDLRFVTSASNKNKSTIIMNCEKEKLTDRWFYITARTHEDLPVPVYGEPIAMSGSSDPWHGAVERAVRSGRCAQRGIGVRRRRAAGELHRTRLLHVVRTGEVDGAVERHVARNYMSIRAKYETCSLA